MKKNIEGISIPVPCNQQWAEMTPVNGGRYCEGCCKTVVDFSHMSTDEIINYLSATKNVCGKFDPYQLPVVNLSLQATKPQIKIWRYFRAVAIVAGLFPFVRSEAQTRKNTHRSNPKHISTKKDTAIRAVKPDSLIAKTLTTGKINIDTRVKGIELADVDLNIPKPLEGFLGSVAVGIPVAADDWRNSYLSWRALFRY